MKISLAITALSLVLTADQQQSANAWAPSHSSATTALTSLIAQQQRRYNNKRATLYSTKDKEETTSTDTTAAAFQETKGSKILGQPIPYSQLTLGVLKETYPGENRVSQTPDSIKTLVKAGMTVVVQSGGTNDRN
jgi:hypothetical protein